MKNNIIREEYRLICCIERQLFPDIGNFNLTFSNGWKRSLLWEEEAIR